jgi:hypothetical protein
MPVCTSSKISSTPAASHSLAQPAQVPRRRHDDAALGLDRLDEDHRARGALLASSARAASRSPYGTRATGLEHRAEALAVLGLAGDRHRRHRPAVEAAVGRDDRRALGLAGDHLLVAAHQLERGLVGLAARVAEVDAIGERCAT